MATLLASPPRRRGLYARRGIGRAVARSFLNLIILDSVFAAGYTP
jgi:hypothetical protein